MADPPGAPPQPCPPTILDIKTAMHPTAAGEGQDAPLLGIAAELAAAEAQAVEALRWHADAERDGDAAALEAASQAVTAAAALIDLALARMAAVPAEGLLGIAIKAGRLCESLIRNRGDLLVAEGALVASLLADCRRIAQDVDDRSSRGSRRDHPG